MNEYGINHSKANKNNNIPSKNVKDTSSYNSYSEVLQKT